MNPKANFNQSIENSDYDILIPIEDKVPYETLVTLRRMPVIEQELFINYYEKKYKNPRTYFILAVFGLHFFFLGKTSQGMWYWSLMGGMGAWWLFELYYVFKRVEEHNNKLASNILRDIKITYKM